MILIKKLLDTLGSQCISIIYICSLTLSCPLPNQSLSPFFCLCVCVSVSFTKVGYRDMDTLQMAIQLMETSALPLPIPPGGVEPQELPLLPWWGVDGPNLLLVLLRESQLPWLENFYTEFKRMTEISTNPRTSHQKPEPGESRCLFFIEH